jgi:hypothetical protein
MGSRRMAEILGAALPSADDTPTSGVKSSVCHGAGASHLGCSDEILVGQARRGDHRGGREEAPAIVDDEFHDSSMSRLAPAFQRAGTASALAAM